MSTELRQLNIDLIVSAAIEVAEANGVGAVTMRNVGHKLGFTGMSLYRHVESKDALLDLMADRVIGEVPDIAVEGSWSDSTIRFFTDLYGVVLNHHELATIFTHRPVTGAHAQRHSRQVLAVLVEGGFAAAQAVELYIALACYTLGAALYAAGRLGGVEPSPAWTGIAGQDLGTDALERLARRADADLFLSGLRHFVRGFASGLSQRGDA